MSDPLLISTLKGHKGKRAPFWFMRQAGRYLPEYREIRKTQKSFLDFCYNPQLASEVTIQPIRRFGMDGAIIFSDILVVPHALGMQVWFEEGHGPRLIPVTEPKHIDTLDLDRVESFLSPVYEALRITRQQLDPHTALIGFVGAPWTLACYAVEGKSGSDFRQVLLLAQEDELFFADLIEKLTQAIIIHAKAQIKAGAQAIQLFDSWAGLLKAEQYARWVIEPARQFIQEIKQTYPDIPLIGFPRESGDLYIDYAQKTGVDAVGIDTSITLETAKEKLQTLCVVQGNLSPQLLLGDTQELLHAARHIVDVLGKKPFVFNLGHGVTPPTPIENVQALSDYLRNA